MRNINVGTTGHGVFQICCIKNNIFSTTLSAKFGRPRGSGSLTGSPYVAMYKIQITDTAIDIPLKSLWWGRALSE